MKKTAKAFAIQLFFVHILPILLWSNWLMGSCGSGGGSSCGI